MYEIHSKELLRYIILLHDKKFAFRNVDFINIKIVIINQSAI